MRDILASLAGTRHHFRARVVRLGNDARGGLTLLLKDITHWQGYEVAEHMWLTVDDATRPACRNLGGVVQFSATVGPYRRNDGSLDFELREFADVRAVGR